MPDISLNYRLVDENIPLISEGITLEVNRKYLEASRLFAGLSVQNPVEDTPGVDLLGKLWDKLHDVKPSIKNLIQNGQEAGVSSQGEIPGCFTYFAGAEVNSADDITADFEKWSMPAGNYVVCSFEAENFYLLVTNALNKARDYMFGVWLPNHKLASEPFMAEIYYETTPEASRMEIWLKINEQTNSNS